MIHPALFMAIWVTAAIPFAMIIYRWFYRSMDGPKDKDHASASLLGAVVILAIYSAVGIAWSIYVSAIYDSQNPKVEVRR